MRILVGLVVVLALALPASANLLSASEGGFEDPWPSQPNAWGGHIERDSTIWGPGGPHSGEHYGSIQSGGGGSGTWQASITSIYVVPSTIVSLTGVWAVGTSTASTSIWVQLIDGSSTDDTVIAEARAHIPAGPYGTGWMPFGPIFGHIITGHIKIVAGIHAAGWGAHALHLDSLNLVPEPVSASLALFGLVGLPFLRRRR